MSHFPVMNLLTRLASCWVFDIPWSVQLCCYQRPVPVFAKTISTPAFSPFH